MTELRRSRTELLMTSAPVPWRLPLTMAGRSPFDPIRLRWGGLGCIGLGALITGTGEMPVIVFGILFILLGLATWLLTGFGGIGWYDINPPGRYVAGTGAIIGYLAVAGFLLGTILVAKAFILFGKTR